MTKDEVLNMIYGYQQYAYDEKDVLYHIRDRFPEDGSENKAMRWLGFCQGILVERGVFNLENVKEHSLSREVPAVNAVSRLRVELAKRPGEIEGKP